MKHRVQLTCYMPLVIYQNEEAGRSRAARKWTLFQGDCKNPYFMDEAV